MFKKTKGYFLLTMLVLTGLAGRTHTDNLPGKERRFLLNEIKTLKINYINVVEGLNKKQLDFHAERTTLSIKDYLSRISAMQNDLLHNVETSRIDNKITTEKQTSIDNSELLNCLNNNIDKIQYPYLPKANFHTAKEAINNYKKQNSKMLLYIRTATDNLHHHLIQTPFGNLNVYQTIDLIAAYTRQSLIEINKIRSNPSFPK